MKKLTIALALMAAVCCSAENLIKNADFQEVDANGKLTVWKYKPEQYSLVKSEDAADEGKQVVSATVTAPEEGEEKTRTFVSLRQRIQLPQAGKYQLTLVGKIEGTAVLNCSWTFFDENKKTVKVGKFWSKVIKGGKDGGWKTVTEIVEVPEGVKSMELRVTTSCNRKRKQLGGTSFIKQVSLEPVTE